MRPESVTSPPSPYSATIVKRRSILVEVADAQQVRPQILGPKEDWQLHEQLEVPQQMNCTDCGIFALLYARFAAARRQLHFSQAHIPYYRRRLCHDILREPAEEVVVDGQPNNSSLDFALPNNSATGDDTCITENNNSPGTTSTTPPTAAAVEQDEDEEDERVFTAKAKQQFIEGALEVIRKGSKANLQRFVDPFLFIEGGKNAEGARGIAWLARDDNDNELAYE